VTEGIVALRHYGDGDDRLVGYYLPNPDQNEPTGTDLRRFIKQKLPSYMVPAVFEALSEFPLTPNGKIDRKALPEPEIYRSDGAGEFAPPTTSMEVALAGIWSEALRTDRIGVDDNFFDLGGHSLLSIQVITKIERKIGVRLDARDMVLQTLRQLATLCEENLGEAIAVS